MRRRRATAWAARPATQKRSVETTCWRRDAVQQIQRHGHRGHRAEDRQRTARGEVQQVHDAAFMRCPARAPARRRSRFPAAARWRTPRSARRSAGPRSRMRRAVFVERRGIALRALRRRNPASARLPVSASRSSSSPAQGGVAVFVGPDLQQHQLMAEIGQILERPLAAADRPENRKSRSPGRAANTASMNSRTIAR